MAKKPSQGQNLPQKNALTNYFARESASPSHPMTPPVDDDTIRVAHRTKPSVFELPSPRKHDAKRRRLDAADGHDLAQISPPASVPVKTAGLASTRTVRRDASPSPGNKPPSSLKSGQSFTSTSDTLLSSAPSQISVPSRFGTRYSSTPGSSSEAPWVLASSDSDEDSLVLDETPKPLESTKVQGQAQNVRSAISQSEESDVDTEEGSSNSGEELHGIRNNGSEPKASPAQLASSNSEDSGSELEDLSSIFKFRKTPQSIGKSTDPGVDTPTGRVLRSVGKSRHTSSNARRRPVYKQAIQPSNEFSLSALIKQSTKDAKVDAQVAEAKSILQHSVPEQHGTSTPQNLYLDQNLVASAYEGKDDVDIQKVLQAMQRTDTTHLGVSWTFFEGNTDMEPIKYKTRWPRLSTSSWAVRFDDAQSRDEAFRSGFLAELFRSTDVPTEIYRWTFAALLHESNEQLQLAYEDALAATSASATAVFTKDFLQQTLASLGGCPAAVDMAMKVVPKKTSIDYASQSLRMRRLCSFLRVLAGVAPCLSRVSRHYAISALTRLCIDIGIVQISHTYVELTRTISLLIDTIPGMSFDHEVAKIVQDISNGLDSRLLQSQLLQAFPGTSQRCTYIKQQLALSFLFPCESISGMGTSDGNTESEMLLHHRFVNVLTERAADMTNSDTDYLNLTATVSVLDLGIGDGQGRPKQLADESSSKPALELEKQEEAGFNARIDALTKKTRYMSARIVDGGTSHLLRTEAKAALERLTFRLEHTVRTKPRPRKPIFGFDKRSHKSLAGAGAAQMGEMHNFLKPVVDDRDSILHLNINA